MSIRTDSAVTSEVFGELSRVLWCQRALIEVLQYRLEVQLLVTSSGNERFIPFAVREVESSMDDIREAEASRDGAATKCAVVLGLSPDAPLSKIRTTAPEPWSSALSDHQKALLELVAETERLSKENREMALRGSRETKELVAAITGSAGNDSYERTGARRGLAAPPALVDREA